MFPILSKSDPYIQQFLSTALIRNLTSQHSNQWLVIVWNDLLLTIILLDTYWILSQIEIGVRNKYLQLWSMRVLIRWFSFSCPLSAFFPLRLFFRRKRSTALKYKLLLICIKNFRKLPCCKQNNRAQHEELGKISVNGGARWGRWSGWILIHFLTQYFFLPFLLNTSSLFH